jgi:undecaprenyl-diphosphatase
VTASCIAGVDTGFVSLGYFKVAVLGLVQGITELLPVSSTAHMKIVPALLGWPDPGSAFSAAMQLAAMTAVVSYFWRDIRSLAVGSLVALRRRDMQDPVLHFSFGILLGFLPILAAGILLSPILNSCESPLRSLQVIGVAMIALAILLGVSEVISQHRRTIESSRLTDFIVVGVAQVGALIPGISRSGSTLTASLFRGFTREDAAQFSFLLGLPAISAAGLKEIWVLHHAGLSLQGWEILGLGLVIASISSFLAVWGLMKYMERFSSWPFVIYRALIGILILMGVATGWLH